MNSKLQVFAATLALAVVLGGYVSIMGHAALSASASRIKTSSERLADQWQIAADTLNIRRDLTEPGLITHTLTTHFGAMELSIYGAAIVKPQFRELLTGSKLQPLTSEVFILRGTEGREYRIGGVELAGIQHLEGEGLAVLYRNMPAQVAQRLSTRRGEIPSHSSTVAPAATIGAHYLDLGTTESGHLSAMVYPYKSLTDVNPARQQ